MRDYIPYKKKDFERYLDESISKPNKYRNRKSEYDGHVFDSRRELGRYLYLKLLVDKGEISNLELQKEFLLIPDQYEETGEIYKRGPRKGENKLRLVERKCSYIADFVYTKDGHMVVEDSKGVRTKEYRIKKKLMFKNYGIKILEV